MSQTVDTLVENAEVVVDERLQVVEGQKMDLEMESSSQDDTCASEASDPAKAPTAPSLGALESTLHPIPTEFEDASLEEAVHAGNEPAILVSHVPILNERPAEPEMPEKSNTQEANTHLGSEVSEETMVVPQMVVELQGSDLSKSSPPADAPPLYSRSSSSDSLSSRSETPHSATPSVDAAPEAGPETAPLSSHHLSSSPDSPSPLSSESPLPLTISPDPVPHSELTHLSQPATSSTSISDHHTPTQSTDTDTPTDVVPPNSNTELSTTSLPNPSTEAKLPTEETEKSGLASPETVSHSDNPSVQTPEASSAPASSEVPESNLETMPKELSASTPDVDTTPRKALAPVSSSSAPDLRSSAVGRTAEPSNTKPSSLNAHSGSVGSRMMNLAEETEMERLRAERATRSGRRGAFYAPPPPVFRPKVGADPNEVVKDPPLSNAGLVLPMALASAASKQAKEPVGRRATVGWADTTGKRPTMEDAWVSYSQGKDSSSLDLFGVFDGHRGDSAAKFAAQHLPGAVTSVMRVSKNPSDWLRLGFIQTNLAMKQAGIATGTTAVVGMYWRNIVYLANAGDSRCVHGKVSPTGTVATRMTQDHKPERIDETERIVALGGEVHTSVNKEGKVVGRVNGQLGVSRALGDFDLEPYIIPDPEITQIDLLRPIPIAEALEEVDEESNTVAAASSSNVASSSNASSSAPKASSSTSSSSNSASPANANSLNTAHPPSRSPSGNTIHNHTITPGSSAHNTASSSGGVGGGSSPQTTTTFTSSAPAATPMANSVQPHNPRASSQPSLSPSRSLSSSPLKPKPRPTSTSSKRSLKDSGDNTTADLQQPDTSNFDFLILACDGLWDVVTDDEAVDMAAYVLQHGQNPEDAAKRLRNVAYGRGSTDNITVLIVILQPPVSGLKKSSSCIIL